MFEITVGMLNGAGRGMASASVVRALLLHLWLWQDGDSLANRAWTFLKLVNREFTIGSFNLSVAKLALGLFVLLLAVFVSRRLRSFLETRLAARTHLDPGLQFTLLRLTHYAIVTAGVFVAFKIAFGADFTSLAVVFTALSVGIGFGLQFIAGDIASGFILLFERPARIGDFVTIAGPDSKITEGRVQTINLRTTSILTNDRITVIVPNSKLVNDNLVNWSYADRRSRISVPIGVAYTSDVEFVTDTLLRAAEGITHVLAEPKPSVQFLDFGESSLDFRLLVWTDRPRRHLQIKSDINYRIWRLFKEADIEIPYPTRDLNLRGATLRLDTPGGQQITLSDADDEADGHEENPTGS